MKSIAECSKWPLAGLVIVTSLLGACAAVSFESVVAACPPVVESDSGFQARAAEEVRVLPDGSAVVEMPSDYAVMRKQARACAS